MELLTAHQYKPIYKPSQVVCGTGRTVIVTGWTVKQAASKRLQPHQYAGIGNLYSPTRGISFLIRNLLANPHVNSLLIIEATQMDRNAGACQCLKDFFYNGFSFGKSDAGKECWVINSSIPGYIDIEIPDHVLELLRDKVKVCLTHSLADLETILRLAQHEASHILPDPLIFPPPILESTSKPGRLYGHAIQGKTIAQAWVKIIHRIKTTGTIRPNAYDGQWQELIDLTAVVTDEPEDYYLPDWLPVSRDFLNGYVSQILEDAPNQEGVKYTYGQRLRSWFGHDQIEGLIQRLVKDLNSARAVASLWDPATDPASDNPPCLNHIWVRVVDGELSLTATFRSNDMFSAWVANALGLSALQRHIRDRVGQETGESLKLGALITISQSAHLYDEAFESAQSVIDAQYQKIVDSEAREHADPVGNFLIELSQGEILVSQTTPGSGEVIDCWSGKNALKLLRQICAANPGIEAQHAGYLGMELGRAAIALSSGNEYIQDQG